MSNPEKRIKVHTLPGDPCPSEMSPNEIYLNDMNDVILELSVRYHGNDTVTLSSTELLLCTQIVVKSEDEILGSRTLFEHIMDHQEKVDDYKEAIEFLRSFAKELSERVIQCVIDEGSSSFNTDFGHIILHDDRHPVLRLLHIFNYEILELSAKQKDLKKFITDQALKDEKVENMV